MVSFSIFVDATRLIFFQRAPADFCSSLLLSHSYLVQPVRLRMPVSRLRTLPDPPPSSFRLRRNFKARNDGNLKTSESRLCSLFAAIFSNSELTFLRRFFSVNFLASPELVTAVRLLPWSSLVSFTRTDLFRLLVIRCPSPEASTSTP